MSSSSGGGGGGGGGGDGGSGAGGDGGNGGSGFGGGSIGEGGSNGPGEPGGEIGSTPQTSETAAIPSEGMRPDPSLQARTDQPSIGDDTRPPLNDDRMALARLRDDGLPQPEEPTGRPETALPSITFVEARGDDIRFGRADMSRYGDDDQHAKNPKVSADWAPDSTERYGSRAGYLYEVDALLLQKADIARQQAEREEYQFSPRNPDDRTTKTASTVTDSTTVHLRTEETLVVSHDGMPSYTVKVGQLEGSTGPQDMDTFFVYWEGINEMTSTMSGYSEQEGYPQGTQKALDLVRHGEPLKTPDPTRRFNFPNHYNDPPDGKGYVAASHAEVQGMALYPPNDPEKGTPETMIYGVSRPQCIDCRAFAQVLAMHQEGHIIIAGPDATRIYYPDGTVGVLPRGQDSIQLYGAREAWDTWAEYLYAAPRDPSTAPGRTALWADDRVYKNTMP